MAVWAPGYPLAACMHMRICMRSRIRTGTCMCQWSCMHMPEPVPLSVVGAGLDSIGSVCIRCTAVHCFGDAVSAVAQLCHISLLVLLPACMHMVPVACCSTYSYPFQFGPVTHLWNMADGFHRFH